jgi:hypothetical protein
MDVPDDWETGVVGTLPAHATNNAPSTPTNSAVAVEDNSATPGYKVTTDDFECLHVIGQGGFGKVLLVRLSKCTHKNKSFRSLYAMKVVSKKYLVKKEQVPLQNYVWPIVMLASFPAATAVFVRHRHNRYCCCRCHLPSLFTATASTHIQHCRAATLLFTSHQGRVRQGRA